jgi:hypothetical protein
MGKPRLETSMALPRRSRRSVAGSLAATILALLLVACGADASVDDRGTPLPSTADEDVPRLVIADGGIDPAAGISVDEALGHGPTDDLVTVTGALFVDADGTVRLCDAVAESFPPQCGGSRIVVDGLNLDAVNGLQTEGEISWADTVTLFGSVE